MSCAEMTNKHVPRETVEAALRLLLGAQEFKNLQEEWGDDYIPMDVRMNSYKYHVINPMKAYFVDNDVMTPNHAGKTMKAAQLHTSSTAIVPRGYTRQAKVDETYTDPRWCTPIQPLPASDDDTEDDDDGAAAVPATNRILASATPEQQSEDDDDDDTQDEDDNGPEDDDDRPRRTYRVRLPGSNYLILGETPEYYAANPLQLPMRLPGQPQWSDDPQVNAGIQLYAVQQGWTPKLWLREMRKERARDRQRQQWAEEEEEEFLGRRQRKEENPKAAAAAAAAAVPAAMSLDPNAQTLRINEEDYSVNPFNPFDDDDQ